MTATAQAAGALQGAPSPRRRAASTTLALACASSGLWIAWHHPLGAPEAVALFLAWTACAWRWPMLWLAALPALLPAADLSPWTGWTAIDEFDLLVLGAAAAGHAHLARDAVAPAPMPRGVVVLIGLLGLSTAIGLAIGWHDAGGPKNGWFGGYGDALNSLRAAKSVVATLLVLPLLQQALTRDREAAVRHLAGGMLAGMAVVCAAVLWERSAYSGLWNVAARYRTVALFWEMHVGGAAIDVYMALGAPFVAWGLWRARSAGGWLAAAVLALVVAYACLTTFSRGVYLAVAAPLALLGLWLSGRRWRFDLRPWLLRCAGATVAGSLVAGLLTFAYGAAGLAGLAAGLALLALALAWQRRHLAERRAAAAWALATALIVEAVIVLGPGSFMLTRMGDTERDFGSRMAHWQRGWATPTGGLERLAGIGLGRLPARYAASGRAGEWSGTIDWRVDAPAGSPRVRLAGPRTRGGLGGLYSLTQRVALDPAAPYRVALELDAGAATVIDVSVCEMHLLYERQCQGARIALGAGRGLRRVETTLAGPLLDAGHAWAPRRAVFAIAVLRPGTSVDIASASLKASGSAELLVNGDFAAGPARWFGAAQYYFLPWHIDNLYLEWLIERGVLGTAAMAWLFGWALAAPWGRQGANQEAGAFAAASVLGALIVGLVSSVMDAPRVAFLLFFLAGFAILVTRAEGDLRRPAAMIPP